MDCAQINPRRCKLERQAEPTCAPDMQPLDALKLRVHKDTGTGCDRDRAEQGHSGCMAQPFLHKKISFFSLFLSIRREQLLLAPQTSTSTNNDRFTSQVSSRQRVGVILSAARQASNRHRFIIIGELTSESVRWQARGLLMLPAYK